MIHPTAIIYPNVDLGENISIGAFCIIGEGGGEGGSDTPDTFIGDGANIRSHTVIYRGNRIGSGFQTGHHAVIREENEIGDNVSVGSLSCVEHHVKIADGVRIHSQAFIPEFCVLEEEAWIGPNVVLTNARYPRSKNVKEQLAGVTVRKQVKIGANATVLPGKELGEFSLIGSGSVVTKDTEPKSVMVGNPARKIAVLDDIEEYN
ncbi:MAG: transferase [Spirochaetaceae bacterium 4572_59]|nr:MAG: transferase [Spirochaetaceae bacterium 4572_59]